MTRCATLVIRCVYAAVLCAVCSRQALKSLRSSGKTKKGCASDCHFILGFYIWIPQIYPFSPFVGISAGMNADEIILPCGKHIIRWICLEACWKASMQTAADRYRSQGGSRKGVAVPRCGCFAASRLPPSCCWCETRMVVSPPVELNGMVACFCILMCNLEWHFSRQHSNNSGELSLRCFVYFMIFPQ